jgi:hypothetical protein
MTFPVLAAFLFVVAVAFFVAASRAIFWDSYGKAALDILVGIVFLAAGVGAGFIALTLAGYQRLSGDEHVTQVQFVRKGDKTYTAMFTYPGPRIQVFDMKGDDWRVGARMLKWNGPSNLLGFSTLFRMDQITGRYAKPEEEKAAPHTAYLLGTPERIDTWQLARDAKGWIGEWVDATEGAAATLPMADNALYEVRVSPTGVAARPLNDAAKKAVAGVKEAISTPVVRSPL